MSENTQRSVLGSLFKNLDNNRSPFYITIALLFYFVPVLLVSFLFIDSARIQQFGNAFIGLAWIVIVILPVMLTFGVFIVYRATYSSRTYLETEAEAVTAKEEELQWDYVINKALDWHRFLMPLCLLNMFITLTGGFLLYADISKSGDLTFGSYTVQMEFTRSRIESQGQGQNLELQREYLMAQIDDLLNQETLTEDDVDFYLDRLEELDQVENALNDRLLVVPGTIFYMGMLGFFVQFLEMTRRRYVSRNIVPRFYLMSAFRLLQVIMAVFVVYLFLNIIIPSPPRDLVLLSSFVVGMFPVQALNPVIDSIRSRLGMSSPKEVSVTLINGVDNTLESLLQEENIDSVQILATTEITELHKRTAIPKRTLINWQRQARLFNVLGTEALIRRFARIGINDFDDLGMLVKTMGSLPTNSHAFQNDFTRAMLIKSDDEAMSTDAYWKVLVQVLIREYYAEYPDAVVEIVPANGFEPILEVVPANGFEPVMEVVPANGFEPVLEDLSTSASESVADMQLINAIEPNFDMSPADIAASETVVSDPPQDEITSAG